MGKNIVALMLQEYENFTRSERKIVDYVLEHQTETQYISITDLSAVCEVAVSTISVFCRKLKLAGFNDFKLELARASLLAAPDMEQRAAGEVLPGDSTSAVMSKVGAEAQGLLIGPAQQEGVSVGAGRGVEEAGDQDEPRPPAADDLRRLHRHEQPLRFGSTAALVAQLYVVDVLLTEFSRRDPEGAEQ